MRRFGFLPLLAGLMLLPSCADIFRSTATRKRTVPSLEYPLSVSPDKRTLLRADGTHRTFTGDAPWSLAVQLTLAEAKTYLQDRQAKGVNTLLFNLIEHHFSSQTPKWLNANGDAPFTGTLGGGYLDFTTPNEAYWSHVDDLIDLCDQYGMLVLVFPAYLGYQMGSEGWAAEVSANGVANMAAYGSWIGARYAGKQNIIWVMGGDVEPNHGPDLTAHVNALANAIKTADPAHLMTAHSARQHSSLDDYNQWWLDINATYSSYTTEPSEIVASRAQTPTMPTFVIESTYEGTGLPGAVDQRRQMYQAALGGTAGYIFGDDDIWSLPAGWETHLAGGAADYLLYLSQLQDLADLSSLTPDSQHTVVTSGYAADRAVAYSNSRLVAYTSGASLVVDKSRFAAGDWSVRWFNPRNGSFTNGGTATMGSGTETFNRPDSNDWVLLLEATRSS